ncbi:MAG: hypothetical protein KGK30_09730, partial [Elusimicrobia bacterium]|nr:hypothetical protein [Elusimicrobiota bacterium]
DSPKAWFAGHPVLDALAKPNAALPDFDRKMAIFTVGGAKRAPANAGPFKGDMAWPAAMLETATEFARQAINDRRLAPQVKASVDTHDQGLPVPGGPGAPGGGLKRGFSARGFNVADLYEKGGVTQFWNIDGTEPPKHLISIRVYSKVSSWGPPPRISDRIGIFDINPDEFKHPSPVHHLVGQYFSLNQTGDSTFQLGSGKSGTFKLSMGADESISLVPVDSQSKEPISDPLTTSISALFAARKGLAASEGYYEKINGQGFRVIGQGGERGALLYYAVGADGRPLSDDPSLIAQVNEVSDGRTQPLSGDRPLGYVGMKADGKTPQAYGLAWNNETKTFDPKEIDSDALGDAPGASSTTVASSDGAPADKGTTADTDDDKGGAGKA